MKASIDIGTNTVLLLVAEKEKDKLRIIYEEQRTPRLGKGVDGSKNLHPDSMERVLNVLKEYRAIIREEFPDVDDIVVTATSAVRDANNKETFIRQIKRESGFSVKLLSGNDEAAYTYRGALSVLPPQEGRKVVIDIGGGSTEIAMGEGSSLEDRFSFDMGSVRFTERFLHNDPPSKKEADNCLKAINNLLNSHPFEIGTGAQTTLVGVAGTVTSLAFMDAGLAKYEPEELNGRSLSLDTINKWVDYIKEVGSDKLLADYPAVMEGRADVLLGGLLILKGFMDYYYVTSLTVSTGGIRHGAILHS